MSSSFSDSFVELGDDDGFQPFDSSFADADADSVKVSAVGDSAVFASQSFPDTSSPPPIYGSSGEFSTDPAEFSSFTQEVDGKAFNVGYVSSDGPILPPPAEMGLVEGVALREWRRENAIRLEEKEKREKELLRQIIAEAEEYKVDFHRRRKANCETNKVTNREKEKLFVASQENFYAKADKNYWKAIAELIPNEVPTIEKKRGKKEDEKKPSIVVVQGPKPGKPTELSRMRHILLKLKHNTPPHLELSAPTAPAEGAGTGGSATVSSPPAKAVVATPVEAVA